MSKLPADAPIRTSYEAELQAAENGLKAAGAQTDQALTTLALQRSQLDRFKLKMDQARLATFGQLTAHAAGLTAPAPPSGAEPTGGHARAGGRRP
jgi:hypothetical protein